ncbi:MAG: diguanylate cyclase [Spirochaetes bacterium]|nr:diguanylate cyclase [Spirochaetota bacterium]
MEYKTKILVVDDEYANRFLLKNLLSDYNVECVDCGESMWEFLCAEIPSLIILDVMMPGEDGFQIAKRLLRDAAYKDIPVIFVTAKDAGADVEEGFLSGGYDYVKKPFDADELKARIKLALKKKSVEMTLKKDSVTDSLTGMYNRRYFFARIEEELERVKRTDKEMAVAIIDIDFFKNVNDDYGHQAGDYILKVFSEFLQKHIRPYDIVARYGGDEFIIMFVEIGREEAKIILKRILDNITDTVYNFNSNYIKYSLSCGISDIREIDMENISADSLIKLADDRLYRAKNEGRNRIIV